MFSLTRVLVFCVVIAVALFEIYTTPARAVSGRPPAQLYGKSISIRWSEDREGKLVTGEAQHRVVYQTLGIYVSTQGRVFSRGARTLGPTGRFCCRNSLARSAGPSGDVIKTSNARYSNDFRFEGRSIVGTAAFESGARRTVVSFDEGFRACTVDITYGKEAGAPGLVARGTNTRLWLWDSVKVSGQSCAIVDGNMFGEGD